MDGQTIGGLINGNLDVPAGTYCKVEWAEVTGNVSVEGVLSASATTFDRTVSVSEPGSELVLFNFTSHIKANLLVTGSSGAPDGNVVGTGTSFFDNGNYATPGISAASLVDGNFTFSGTCTPEPR